MFHPDLIAEVTFAENKLTDKNYFLIPWSVKINSVQRLVGGATNVCFATSKSMDLNDFIYRSNN